MGVESERWLDRLNALPLSEEEKGEAFVLILGNQDIQAVLTSDKTTSGFLISAVKALLQQGTTSTVVQCTVSQPPLTAPHQIGHPFVHAACTTILHSCSSLRPHTCLPALMCAPACPVVHPQRPQPRSPPPRNQVCVGVDGDACA